MSKIAYADLMQGWSVLTRSLAEHGCEPFVEVRRSELEAALAEVKQRLWQHDILRSQMGTNIKLLREAVERGQEMEARLRALLKGTYGGDSVDLIRFGLRPRRKRRRGAAGGENEAAEAGAPEAQAGAQAGAPALEIMEPAAEEPESPTPPAPPARRPSARARGSRRRTKA